MPLRLFKKPQQPDHIRPCPPYFLKAENLFARNGEREIFIKKIYSVSSRIPKRGSVIMAPGIACNANLFRISEQGDILGMNHNHSFANYLASEGFEVYLYHPGYTERTHNRYVSKYCKESIWYGKRYKIPPNLSFVELVELELPSVIDFVVEHSKQTSISWIGFSMGGMLMYSYLSKHKALAVKNVITIGSPLSLSQIFIRIIPYTNVASKALGFEETKFLGTLTENLVPLTRLIRILPAWILKYNLLSFLLFNPLNIKHNTVKTMLGKIVEPIPARLERCFSDIISCGFAARENYQHYIGDLRKLGSTRKNFLFFYGPNDMLSPPDTVYLAHEVISPDIEKNLVPVPSAGHVDMIVGKNSMKNVWIPSAEWLKDKTD